MAVGCGAADRALARGPQPADAARSSWGRGITAPAAAQPLRPDDNFKRWPKLQRMDDTTGKALIPVATAEGSLTPAGERQLPAELIEQAKTLRVEARAEGTRGAYARCWRNFTAWCEASGRIALPADADTLAGYLAWLAAGKGTGRLPAIASLQVVLAALKLAHQSAGH